MKAFCCECAGHVCVVRRCCVVIMAGKIGSREKGSKSHVLDLRLDFVCRLVLRGGSLGTVGSGTIQATFSCTALHPISRWHRIRSSMVALDGIQEVGSNAANIPLSRQFRTFCFGATRPPIVRLVHRLLTIHVASRIVFSDAFAKRVLSADVQSPCSTYSRSPYTSILPPETDEVEFLLPSTRHWKEKEKILSLALQVEYLESSRRRWLIASVLLPEMDHQGWAKSGLVVSVLPGHPAFV